MSADSPLVSIIMNCYNSDTYLKLAIDSVFAQSYKNWEIIFWDNNSSDNSAEIALKYDKKLKYFKAKNTAPLYHARNLAIQKCSGTYVAFLDCDDTWVDSKLEKQLELAKRGFDFVYGGYATICENGSKKSDNLGYLVSGNITNSLFKRNPISIGTVILKKSLLLDNHFDPVYDLLGDLDMWIRLSQKCKIAAVKSIVEYSRQHNNNTSIKLKHKWKIERRYFYLKFLTLSNIIRYPAFILYILKTELLGLVGR